MSGNLLYISGQLPFVDGALVTGKLGEHHDVDTGYSAAQACGIGLIAQMKAACGGDLSKVKRVVKLGGFVQAAATALEGDIPKVINGCSDIMVAAFGEAGRHARFAVSAPSLPRDVAVEIDAIVEISV